MGVPHCRTGDKSLVTVKAEISIKQFKSVFTLDKLQYVHQQRKYNKTHRKFIPTLQMTEETVKKLLKAIHHQKLLDQM